MLCDFLEDNPGQYMEDKFYLVSTTDKDAILEVEDALEDIKYFFQIPCNCEASGFIWQ